MSAFGLSCFSRALCRWRARQIVKNIPPSDMEQIKAKVAALDVLEGLRKDWGCCRSWSRNYLVSVSICHKKGGVC